MESVIEQILNHIGESPSREGLLETPKRVVKTWDTLYGGYNVDIASLFTVFSKDNYKQMVVLKDIEFYSMCEHHMLPFFGVAHIAYIPSNKVIGVSKLARVVDAFARRLQIQEKLGDDIIGAINTHLAPVGVACILEATHMCMRMRGVGKQSSTMVTSSFSGAFEERIIRDEFLSMLKK